MLVKPLKTRIFKERENLLEFITSYFKKIPNNAIIVVTSKIVALSEGRTAVVKDTKDKEKLIRAESDMAWPTKYVWLTIKDGMLMASAGIDESNADGKLILLPKDSFKTAQKIRTMLCKKYNLKNLGVLITDSRTTPLRAGVTGAALGYAGFKGTRDYRKKLDVFGRPFVFSQTNVADCLASAAVLVMGEGNEQCPLACITHAPVEWRKKVHRDEVSIDTKDDMYLPLLSPKKPS